MYILASQVRLLHVPVGRAERRDVSADIRRNDDNARHVCLGDARVVEGGEVEAAVLVRTFRAVVDAVATQRCRDALVHVATELVVSTQHCDVTT